MKHVGMPRSATPATQNDMTTASDTSKKSRSCNYSHRHGHTALTRTVADGCGPLRTVANGCECKRNVRRTQLYPHTPRVKREPSRRIREKSCHQSSLQSICPAKQYQTCWLQLSEETCQGVLERGGWTKGRTGVGMARRKQLECRGQNIRVKASESTGYS